MVSARFALIAPIFIVLILILIGDFSLQSPLIVYLMPPDGYQYYEFEFNIFTMYALILAGNGNFWNVVPYFLVGQLIVINNQLTVVVIVNLLMSYMCLRNLRLRMPELFVLSIFICATFVGMSKELMLFNALLLIMQGRFIVGSLITAIARLPMLLITIMNRYLLRRVDILGTILIAIGMMFIVRQSRLLDGQIRFADTLDRSGIGNAIEGLLSGPPHLFLLGLLLSSIRLVQEILFSLHFSNLFGLTNILITMLLALRVYTDEKPWTRDMLKLVSFLFLFIAASPFPHGRYLMWAILLMIALAGMRYNQPLGIKFVLRRARKLPNPSYGVSVRSTDLP